jgi:SAM-dependent methyltransferase
MQRRDKADTWLSERESTAAYYERNAARYSESTLNVDMSALYQRFLGYVPVGGWILDAGSGSGRDTLAFLKRGYRVQAFDASPTLAALSTRVTGVETKVMRFEDLAEVEKYDGIWACAALLHVRHANLPKVLARFARALKDHGVIYMSFKLGNGERIDEMGRFFTDMNKHTISQLVENEPRLNLAEVWITNGEDTLSGKEIWLNAIVVRK